MIEQGNVVVDDKLGFIQKCINSGDYDVAVKESCTVFEIVFRKIFQKAVVSLPYRDRETILEIERRIGKGNKGVQDFGFGELVGLFRESNLMDKWSKHTSQDLGLIKSLDYSSIVNLRNRITHNGGTCSRGEANIVYEYLRNLLAVLGFADLDDSINQSFIRKDPGAYTTAEHTHSESVVSLEDRLPKIRKTSGKSAYSSSYGNERERLAVQSQIMRSFDLRALDHVVSKIKSESGLIALDVGCADGTITVDRFERYGQFARVIGVDINEVKIEEAKGLGYDSAKFSFHQMDVESSDFEDKIEGILREYGHEQFDVIFSAFTLHHLANPLKLLYKLRKLLKKDGYIVLRGADDGSKMAYPDEQNLVESLVKLTKEAEGASDRENGRKLYHQLWKSGFRSIEMLYNNLDTTTLTHEERDALFRQSFSYRINYFKKKVDNEPNNPQVQAEYKWVRDALEELEIEFMDESFYYIEMHTIAIGKK